MLPVLRAAKLRRVSSRKDGNRRYGVGCFLSGFWKLTRTTRLKRVAKMRCRKVVGEEELTDREAGCWAGTPGGD